MNSPSLWHTDQSGFTFIEMLFALAIFSIITLGLVGMQWQAFTLATEAVASNNAEQFLNVVQNRLLYTLPGSQQIRLYEADLYNPAQLVARQSFEVTKDNVGTIDTRELVFFISADDKVAHFFEVCSWDLDYKGRYQTPVATFAAAEKSLLPTMSCILHEEEAMLEITLSCGTSLRNFSIWLRNMAPLAATP
ncbi:MAG: prepilin-type N-terminal cleavage/methylation domain-containing protein [Symbiobacteriaceae bacterium]|nr:prepilin-type N-terminal cleavage/methylation domain-containing protein [Symbiobacteriaceae bacterium]